ncbi:uncharacterized protein LOC133196345 [Saccostrea echinata]|uniref:uncharacterized protein LOC133196345 n=1 Tax=Saccostrea echinata TaxID=191078 RepID=UPI002A80ABF1|nr:uncharacterized protein LOC133196345 [Saccostrea echinata]
MLKSEIVSFETKLSSCKSDAEEKIPSLREQLDREVKARELLQEEEKLKSEVLEKTLESILSSTEQFATEDLKNKYPADVWENTEPWVQKMKSYLEKIEVVKLNEKNEKSGLNFKLRTMEGLLTALKKNTMTTIGDVNAELESYDESTRKYLQKWYQKVQKRLESMLLEKNKIQCEIANLKHTQTELEENRDQLLNRLSQVAGAKLKENNPNITDLSDPNRPLKLAEQFSELYDKEWTNALEELSKTEMEEKSAIDLLLELITKCYQFCLRDSEQSLQTFLMCEDSDWRIGLNADEHHLLSETRKSLAKVHIRQIKERFLKENKMKKKSQKNLSHFITRSLELCWYMVIQNPPIHMEVHFPTDSPLIKSILKEYTISGDTISYLVWPPLYLHKDGPLLSKGVAQPQPKPKQRRQRQSTDRPATAPR